MQLWFVESHCDIKHRMSFDHITHCQSTLFIDMLSAYWSSYVLTWYINLKTVSQWPLLRKSLPSTYVINSMPIANLLTTSKNGSIVVGPTHCSYVNTLPLRFRAVRTHVDPTLSPNSVKSRCLLNFTAISDFRSNFINLLKSGLRMKFLYDGLNWNERKSHWFRLNRSRNFFENELGFRTAFLKHC